VTARACWRSHVVIVIALVIGIAVLEACAIPTRRPIDYDLAGIELMEGLPSVVLYRFRDGRPETFPFELQWSRQFPNGIGPIRIGADRVGEQIILSGSKTHIRRPLLDGAPRQGARGSGDEVAGVKGREP
jgi:hypothetical protein